MTEQSNQYEEILTYVQENDVKFVRLAFCDISGRLKNISINADELPHVLVDGIGFDASAVEGFTDAMASDLRLMPDPATITILPWRPQQGRVARVYCDVLYADGTPFENDGRRILRGAVKRLAALGLKCRIGLECEFYLFTLDDQGEPILKPHDQAGYLDFAPLDKGENVRREICLSLEAMGIKPLSSHHESGPGQNEISLKAMDPLGAADAYITFRHVARTVAARYGLYASFLPKPLKELSGSGLHLSLSLLKDGENVFKCGDALTEQAQAFMQSILQHVDALSAFLNSLPGSYGRLGSFDAPSDISWSHQNRAQLARVPADKGAYARMELRSPDPAINPYASFALLLAAGAAGIEQGLALQREHAVTGHLPKDLLAAVMLARGSAVVRQALPEGFLTAYLDGKEREYRHMYRAEDPAAYEMSHYFPRI